MLGVCDLGHPGSSGSTTERSWEDTHVSQHGDRHRRRGGRRHRSAAAEPALRSILEGNDRLGGRAYSTTFDAPTPWWIADDGAVVAKSHNVCGTTDFISILRNRRGPYSRASGNIPVTIEIG